MVQLVLTIVACVLIAMTVVSVLTLVFRPQGGDLLEVGDQTKAEERARPRSPARFLALLIASSAASWFAWGSGRPSFEIRLPPLPSATATNQAPGAAAEDRGPGWPFNLFRRRSRTEAIPTDDKTQKPAGSNTNAAGVLDEAQPPVPDFAAALWRRQPTAAQIAAAYPREGEGQGLAILLCQATATGRLQTCRVTAESPRDQGFGDAALRLSRHYALRLQPGRDPGGRSIPLMVRFPRPVDPVSE